MTTDLPLSEADLDALTLTDLLVAIRAQQHQWPSLPPVRDPQADPDPDTLQRELERLQPLRRALTVHLLQVLGTPDEGAPERQALFLLMALCRDEGLRNGRRYAAVRQAWLARMAQLTSHPELPLPPNTLDVPLSSTRRAWKAEREQLGQTIQQLQGRVTELKAKLNDALGPSERPAKRLSPKKQAAGRAELLAALRSRDDALAAQDRLEERLSRVVEVYGDDVLARRLGTASQRERENLLTHFRRRLQERFGLTMSYAEVSGLDRQARLLPVTHRTGRGTPVKRLQVAGQGVYAVVTPDLGGDLTLTTAYTAGMLDQIVGF